MTSDYLPPTSAAILERQDHLLALRLLIAQRRLYRKAKFWLGLRWAGMVIIGIGAPVVTIVWPSMAVASAAIAGLWIFIGRTDLHRRQTELTEQAAAVQERVDFYIFDMPTRTEREALPSLEDIADMVGPDDGVPAIAAAEQLTGWYPIDPLLDGTVSVAIAQRANAEYSRRLIRFTSSTWTALVFLWLVAIVVLAMVVDMSVADAILGVLLPVLPALLDVGEHIDRVRKSSADRDDLVRAITRRLEASEVDPNDLLVWQSSLYDLRRQPPDVPDRIYKLTRKGNEFAMKRAAQELADKSRGDS